MTEARQRGETKRRDKETRGRQRRTQRKQIDRDATVETGRKQTLRPQGFDTRSWGTLREETNTT